MTALGLYDEWADFLLKLQAIVSPAELQGMLCGRLSGGQRLGPTEWLQAAVEFMDLVDSDLETALDDESQSALLALYADSLANLSDYSRPLNLLLPPDEVTLRQRIDALAGWCEGFLHGLGASGLEGSSQLPPDVVEALRDLAQISQATLDEEELEENEFYYTELVEYVRVAVLTLFTELNPASSAMPGQVH
jgi:uncharacterized protein YgfB (UPF0149 family)